MADGIGCTCHAYSENECGCGVDWTPQEIYDLRAQLAKCQKIVDAAKNLLAQRGRHNTEIAYLRLEETMKGEK